MIEALKLIGRSPRADFRNIMNENDGISMLINSKAKIFKSMVIETVCRIFERPQDIPILFPWLVDIIYDGIDLKNIKTALRGIQRIVSRCSGKLRNNLRNFLIETNSLAKMVPSLQYSFPLFQLLNEKKKNNTIK